jgi:hypothetical protein
VLLALAFGIFLVWAIGFLFSLFFNREMDAAVHGIMLTLVTTVFGGAALAGRRNGRNGKDSGGA